MRDNAGRFRGPIDFAALADALLQRADSLVPRWLPNGTERAGRWYVGDFDGSAGESANVNLATGTWIDNGGTDDDKGGDLISLYARIHNLNNRQAAIELMDQLGWLPADVQAPAPPGSPPAPARAAEPQAPPGAADEEGEGARAARERKRERWTPVAPVPHKCPRPQAFRFSYRDKKANPPQWVELEAVRVWEYHFEGQFYGYVCRFERENSEGGISKETVPLTWCMDNSDDRGHHRWHWKQWSAPRPLYVPRGSFRRELPVVIVEGEKCADAGHQLLGDEFDFVAWPGGCKTWAMASWGWIMGRSVILWPDADLQRQALTKAEKEAGVEAWTKDLLPLEKQPGYRAMVGLGSLLVVEQGCEVRMVGMHPPDKTDRGDGWDIADAIAEGWDADRVRGYLLAAPAFEAPDPAVNAAAAPTPSPADASPDELLHAWRGKLLCSAKGAVLAARENAVLALDGLPELKLPGVPEAAGVIAFNEFTNDVVKLKPAPWGSPAGVWAEVDELLLGEWLVRAHGLPSMPRGTLEESVAMVAYRHRYHPVREYLATLEGKWDGTPRLATWLRTCCLEEDEWDDKDPLHQYLARAGTWFVMGMCQRVLQPGCKFDYMLILEGPQGRRKSTLLATLAGDWFADTGLVLGDKDSYQQLQGKWLYEMGELDAMGKAEITKVKQYIASSKDYFRASFDRRARDYPRQVVFGGTTNEDHYLVDPTGNRRFWPVRVTRVCDIEWLAANRDQLFAEALDRIKAGKRMHPVPEEEKRLFEPQQQLRQVESAIESALVRYLSDDPQGQLVKEMTLIEALQKVGIGIEKLGPGRFHEKQAGAALRRLGWIEGRASRPGPNGARPRVYRRPEAGGQQAPVRGNSSPQSTATEGTADVCPF